MDRTTATGYFTNGAGLRVFVDENLVAGIDGTDFVANDATAFQEELMGIIEGFGLTGDASNLKQAYAAIRAGITSALAPYNRLIAAQTRVTFHVSGTYTVPAGVYAVFVRVWAAGGGSGGTNGSTSASLGGGAGGYAEGWIAVNPGDVIAVTVGLAGSAGVASSTPTAGAAGGTSSFGTFISALGGNGGAAANGGIIGPVAGGGIGIGGDFQANGGTSFAAYAAPVGVVTSAGGAAWCGAMAHLGATGSPADGVAGFFPGGGAAGAANGGNGAPGANGFVTVGC